MNIHEFLTSDYGQSILTIALVFGWDDVLIAFALLVVSATITALTTKKSPSQDAAASKLAEFQIPNITEGTAQTVVFGDVWLTSWQVLWYGDLRTEAIRSARSGKK